MTTYDFHNDIPTKIQEQIEKILEGEAKLMALAEQRHVNMEDIEKGIRAANGGTFFTDNGYDNVVYGAYLLGRKDQAFAIYVGLLGVELTQQMLDRACIKLGITQRKLN